MNKLEAMQILCGWPSCPASPRRRTAWACPRPASRWRSNRPRPGWARACTPDHAQGANDPGRPSFTSAARMCWRTWTSCKACSSAARALGGRLRVDMPSGVARYQVLPRLDEFLQRHPRLELELSSTDRKVDIVREGFDCVLRVGAQRFEPGGAAAGALPPAQLRQPGLSGALRRARQPGRSGAAPAGALCVHPGRASGRLGVP